MLQRVKVSSPTSKSTIMHLPSLSQSCLKILKEKLLLKRIATPTLLLAEYFYELRLILASPKGESKYKQRVKILSDTTQQNV